MNKRRSDIDLPPPFSRAGRESRTHHIACGAGLGFFSEYPPDLIVISHSYGVTALALRDAIDACRKVGSIFRSISRLRYIRLAGEKARKAVFAAGKLHPFLSEQRTRNGKQYRRREQWHQTH